MRDGRQGVRTAIAIGAAAACLAAACGSSGGVGGDVATDVRADDPGPEADARADGTDGELRDAADPGRDDGTGPIDAGDEDGAADPGAHGDAPGDVDAGEPDVPPACDLSTDGMRIEVSADRPLFVWNLCGGPGQVAALATTLPDDVRGRFALHYVPPEPYDFGDAWQAGVEEMADAADAAGLPLFVQIEHGNTVNPAPREYWDAMFDAHPMLAGLVFSEICWRGLWFTGLDDGTIARMIAALDAVAAHGGFLLWQDMATDTLPEIPHVFLTAGADAGLMAAFRRNARHVIVQDKHNGLGKRFVNAAAPMGLWASCAIGNWGTHSEDWLWWEAGFSRLFQPSSGTNRSGPSWPSTFTFPDAMYGIDWLAGLAGGATVFGVETPFHGMGSCDGKTLSPAFRNVLLPLIRQMLAGRLGPVRNEARARMKVAYQPRAAVLQDLMGDGIFRGLYGPTGSGLDEWLPSTGRYYFVPILPVRSTAGERALFAEVIDSDRWTADLSDEAARRAFFDQRFPADGEGDAWFVRFPGRVFAFNPNENADVDTSFRLPLDDDGRTLGAVLPAHTMLLAVARDDGLDVHLSNYRTDAEADVWSDPTVQDDPMAYIDGTYLVDPTDDALRRTTVSIGGLAAQADLDVTRDPEATVVDAFDAGTQSVTVDHNGWVTLRFAWTAAP